MAADRKILGRISLDVDDTIAGVWEHILSLHNEQISANYEPEDVKDWRWESIHLTTEQFYGLYNRVWQEMPHKIELLADKKLLLKLAKHYEIELVTSRGKVPELEATVAPLRKWLAAKGIDNFRLVINAVHSEKDVLGYDIYIDDSPSLAMMISKSKGKILFLVDHPYNRNIEDSKNVKRVSDVNEALRALAEMADRELGLKHE